MAMPIAIIIELLSCTMGKKTEGLKSTNKRRVDVDSWEFHENARVAHDRKWKEKGWRNFSLVKVTMLDSSFWQSDMSTQKSHMMCLKKI